MIKVAGVAKRSFIFPADISLVLAYYSDADFILTALPYISILQSYGNNQYRVLYRKTELGSYRIRIIADVQFSVDQGAMMVEVNPLEGQVAVRAKSGFNYSEAAGSFHIRSVFQAEGQNQTQIDYALQLRATLPTPLGLRLMPGQAVDKIADKITRARIDQIASGFIERSLASFPRWLARSERDYLSPKF